MNNKLAHNWKKAMEQQAHYLRADTAITSKNPLARSTARNPLSRILTKLVHYVKSRKFRDHLHRGIIFVTMLLLLGTLLAPFMGAF